MSRLGYGAAIGSAVLNGSFAALSKLVPAQHPFVFNALLGIGGLLNSAFLALVLVPLLTGGPVLQAQVDPVAGLSGVLLGLATLFSFLAIPRVGLALAQGVWCGTSVAVSFAWGTVGPRPIGQSPQSTLGSGAGIMLIIFGILCIVFNDQLANRIQRRQSKADTPEEEALLDPEQKDKQQIQQPPGALGLVFALCAGLIGGSILVPASLAKLQGFDTVLSLGIGACITTAVPALTELKGSPCRGSDVWPGIVAGIVLNLSFVLSIYANAEVSFAVAQPILQTALVVSGLIGICVFKEIQGSARVAMFFAAAAVVLVGAAMLAMYGPAMGGTGEPESAPE
jgi:glucose uptake protein GlcU